MKNVTIADFGGGNILSVVHAFQHIGCNVCVTSDAKAMALATAIVIPGVGTFSSVASKMESLGLSEQIRASARIGTPILGICLGMQLLFTTGYETVKCGGLDLLQGSVTKMPVKSVNKDYTLPSIGWKELVFGEKPLIPTASDHDGSVYFVHSYEVKPTDLSIVTAYYQRADDYVVASVRKENIWGMQFHPEKSGEFGLGLLSEFVNES